MEAEYIERQAVIDEIDEEIQEFPECEYALKFAKRWIKKIHTADVRPVVRGRWEEVEVTWLADVEDQPDAIASMFCPECRRFANHVYHYGDPCYGMNFCPHCGARMGGDAK